MLMTLLTLNLVNPISLSNIHNNLLKCIRIYKEKLKEFSFKCRKKIESECLSLIEHYLNSKIQFIKSNITQDYMQKLFDNLKFYFEEQKVLSKINIEFINRGWTLNFDENN
jgi:hypothetical protein